MTGEILDEDLVGRRLDHGLQDVRAVRDRHRVFARQSVAARAAGFNVNRCVVTFSTAGRVSASRKNSPRAQPSSRLP
jgi:hypothetical protein